MSAYKTVAKAMGQADPRQKRKRKNKKKKKERRTRKRTEKGSGPEQRSYILLLISPSKICKIWIILERARLTQ
jgi:hypothetical protein